MTTTHAQIITENLAHMRSILDAAGPDGLTEDQTRDFDQAEARVRANREVQRRSEEIAGLDPGLVAAAGAGPSTVAPEVRAVGNLPPVAFAPDDLAELHRRFLTGEPATLEARAIDPAGTPAEVPGFNLDPVAHRFEPLRIAGLMPTQAVESRTVTYYRQNAPADAATAVAEGAEKPESTPGWEPVEVPVRKLAHWTEVSAEALADYGNFASVIRDALTAGLVAEENAQVLGGDGIGENLLGILNADGIATYAPDDAEERLYSVLAASTMLRSGGSFTEPDVVLLHPQDWAAIQRTTDTDGGLLVTPNPTAGTTPSLWGTPVRATTALAPGTAVVANLANGAVVFNREAPRILVDPFSRSTANLVRFICEERLAVGVTRPTSVVRVTFNTGA